MITTLERCDSSHPKFIELVRQLDTFLSVKDGDQHEFYNQFNGIDAIPYVVVVFIENLPVACGAMKPYNDSKLEVKRMFTQPNHRGKGLGKTILNELTKWAKEMDYSKLILETGKHFDEAIGLYNNYGFRVIPNYGQYHGVSTSVCFEKAL